MWLAMVIIGAAVAVTPVALDLPPGEPTTAWQAALSAAGLAPAGPDSPCHARAWNVDGTWIVEVIDRDGVAHDFTLDAPNSADERIDLALLVASLVEPAESTGWATLDALPPAPEPPPAKPARVPPPVKARAPAVVEELTPPPPEAAQPVAPKPLPTVDEELSQVVIGDQGAGERISVTPPAGVVTTVERLVDEQQRRRDRPLFWLEAGVDAVLRPGAGPTARGGAGLGIAWADLKLATGVQASGRAPRQRSTLSSVDLWLGAWLAPPPALWLELGVVGRVSSRTSWGETDPVQGWIGGIGGSVRAAMPLFGGLALVPELRVDVDMGISPGADPTSPVVFAIGTSLRWTPAGRGFGAPIFRSLR